MSCQSLFRFVLPRQSLMLLGAVVAACPLQAIGEQTWGTVPKAVCGPQDRTETVQGQTTPAERRASGPAKAYNCNLELVGQFEGEGSALGMNVFQNCAYYVTWSNPGLRHPGVPVLDISDPRHPKLTTYLDSEVMRDANDSLEFDPTRKLLFASQLNATTVEVYDLSKDCRRPVLKSRIALPGVYSHSGQFTKDGRTFYGASYGVRKAPKVPEDMVPALYAIDASDAAKLRLIAQWTSPDEHRRTHGISVNADGTRAYATFMRHIGKQAAADVNGLAIFDVSDIQARRPKPQFRLISTLLWDDAHLAQFTVPMQVRGRPYLVFTDISGSSAESSGSDACRSGKPTYGFARIIDIGDERQPKIAAKLMLEAQHPSHCTKVIQDPTAGFGYGSFACDADNDENARMLACGYFEGGLRVFDVRDPARPKELAYYKPPARRTEKRPGSFAAVMGKVKDHTADEVLVPRFLDNQQIAFNSSDNGFMVVRFSDRFQRLNKELFRR